MTYKKSSGCIVKFFIYCCCSMIKQCKNTKRAGGKRKSVYTY